MLLDTTILLSQVNGQVVHAKYDVCLRDIGYGGFTFFIGLLPAAYTFSAIGMISSMVSRTDSTRAREMLTYISKGRRMLKSTDQSA